MTTLINYIQMHYSEFTDTDEIVQPEQSHYDYGMPQQQQKSSHHLPNNALNTINAVLLRKTALNKLSR